MNPKNAPLPILIIGWLFVVVGGGGIVQNLLRSELFQGGSLHGDDISAIASGVIALVGGVLMLRATGAGRWLIMAWLVFHVVLSWLHTIPQLLIHAALLLVIGYFLLRPQASAFFRRR